MFFVDCAGNFITCLKGHVLVREDGHGHALALSFQSQKAQHKAAMPGAQLWLGSRIQQTHMAVLNAARSISSPPNSPVWLPQFNHEGGIFTRAGAFKIHNERNDKLCLEKEALLEGVGGAQLPENRYLWFEPPRPWPLVAHRAAAPGAPAGPSVHMKVLS